MTVANSAICVRIAGRLSVIATINAVITGDVDMAATSVPEGVIPAREAADEGKIQLVENHGETEEAFVMVNQLQPPFDSLTARQAMAYATDQAAYIGVKVEGPYKPEHYRY